MNLEQIVEQTLRQGVYPAELQHRYLSARPAEWRDLPGDLHPNLRAALSCRGVHRLYRHQAEAYTAAMAGQHLVVVTPTASGKTLCYNLPILQRMLCAPDATRSLYLYPTKALAQDQQAELGLLVAAAGSDLQCSTYDGDTPTDRRAAIRQSGHLVLTNPDMLHAAILPHHARWVRLFEHLRFVVIDEVHTYRGVFGSHLANVLRRLRRIAAFYGSDPVFLCTSATIANPRELAENLTGHPMLQIDRNGAPAGPRHFFFYNPPLVHPALGVRKSPVAESVFWAERLLSNDVPTIVFGRGRLQVELLLTHLRGALGSRGDRVHGYRGGYLPSERRAIERGLRAGTVTGVVSTNALELGVDIGSLQAAVLCGYPGSIASTWQQAGRAGRRLDPSLVVFVAGNDPLEQFLVRYPEFIIDQSPESGLINPENLYVLMNQLKCAAFELPFGDRESFGPGPTGSMLAFLAEEGILRKAGTEYHWMADHFPANDLSLRGTEENVVIIDRTGPPRVIGEIDAFGAMLMVHEEAIYLHEGTSYQVEVLDLAEKKAFVRHVDADYYTDADLATDLRVLDVLDGEGPASGQAPPGAAAGADPVLAGLVRSPEAAPEVASAAEATPLFPGRAWGEVLVTARATVFKKIRLETHENVGWGKIHLPERNLHTTAYWLSFPANLEAELGRQGLAAALVGVAHAIGGLAPLFVLCDPRDLRTVAQVKSPWNGLPTVFLWETAPGGVGLAEKLYEAHGELVRAAATDIADCACAQGCPACVGPPGPGDLARKVAALRALASLIPGA